MKKISKIISIFCMVSFLVSLCGCTDTNSNRALLFETVTNIVNIDPQLATNDTELHVVYNTYEGLMKYNKAGVLTNGVAESFEVTNGGKTYTFKLKKSAKWSDGRPLTASDFVFAFTRAVSPETQSPYSSTLLPIKNVAKILSGKKKPQAIGVRAINDYELEIQLESLNSGFLDLLTTPVTMPCNEDFFLSCKGYYGLNKKSILSNGYYSVTAWNEDYCTLKANKEYELQGSAEISETYIYFNSQDELFNNIEKEETDFTLLDKEMIDRLVFAEIDINPIHIGNAVHSLIINPESQLAEENILKALTHTVKLTVDEGITKKYGITPASSILPSIVDYSDEICYHKPTLSKTKALDAFILGCENLNVERIFPAFSIIYVKDDITESIAQQIAANWQSNFGVTVNITAVENEETFNSLITSGSYQAAIMRTVAISSSPTAYMQQFTSDSTTNIFGYKNKKYDKAITKMNKASGEELKEATQKAVNILEDYEFMYPLFISSKTYYFKQDVTPSFNKRNQIVYFSQLNYK